MKKLWTVIGVYDDNGQVVSWRVMAEEAHEAMRLVAAKTPSHLRDEFQIVCAVAAGRALVFTPSESGSAAYACDLLDDADASTTQPEQCTDCREPIGSQHRPSCHRQGVVPFASVYVAGGEGETASS